MYLVDTNVLCAIPQALAYFRNGWRPQGIGVSALGMASSRKVDEA
jgi:hypothetical protein